MNTLECHRKLLGRAASGQRKETAACAICLAARAKEFAAAAEGPSEVVQSLGTTYEALAVAIIMGANFGEGSEVFTVLVEMQTVYERAKQQAQGEVN